MYLQCRSLQFLQQFRHHLPHRLARLRFQGNAQNGIQFGHEALVLLEQEVDAERQCLQLEGGQELLHGHVHSVHLTQGHDGAAEQGALLDGSLVEALQGGREVSTVTCSTYIQAAEHTVLAYMYSLYMALLSAKHAIPLHSTGSMHKTI